MIRLVTFLLYTAIVVLAFALSVAIIVSGYDDWTGVLRDPGATDPSRQFTLYSVLARYAIAFGVTVGTAIFAWEQLKAPRPQIGRLVIVLALLLAAPAIYIVTH